MKNNHYKQWLIFAPLGLAIFGFGLALFGEANTMKAGGTEFIGWFSFGTLALVVVNAGLSLFGRAIINRAKWEWEKDQNKAPGQENHKGTTMSNK